MAILKKQKLMELAVNEERWYYCKNFLLKRRTTLNQVTKELGVSYSLMSAFIKGHNNNRTIARYFELLDMEED